MQSEEQIRAEIEANRNAYLESDDEFDRATYYQQMRRAERQLERFRSFDVV